MCFGVVFPRACSSREEDIDLMSPQMNRYGNALYNTNKLLCVFSTSLLESNYKI